MSFQASFEDPSNYEGKYNFFSEGSSPTLVQNLIDLIENNKGEIQEINLCWYLFNNLKLHNYLKEVSKEIVVNIITIPLEGYDNSNPKKLKNLKDGSYTTHPYTKYDLAKRIFSEVYFSENLPNYNIYFFSHIYVRSPYVKKFSRGQLPYSLHIKAGYIKKNNKGIMLLSSSNLAVRDLVKYESMLIIEDEPEYQKSFETFFMDIIKNSIPIKKFTESNNINRDPFSFQKAPINKNSFFTAPFYFDSPHLLENELIEIILSAKDRIIICAQHLAAYNYEFNSVFHSSIAKNEIRKGVLGCMLEMANKGVEITCLSQTFSPPDAFKDKFAQYDFRAPANPKNFQAFYTELAKYSDVKYFVNENIHSKFIIVDNKLICCTYNFTPTQFIYLDKVEIDHFVNMPNENYKGVHCEISCHVIINDKKILGSFLNHLTSIADSFETIKVL